MPGSRSISIVSSTCSRISRASSPPQVWISRSARVDLPWSIWAMIAKLRIWLSGVVMMFQRVPPEHKDALSPDQRDWVPSQCRCGYGECTRRRKQAIVKAGQLDAFPAFPKEVRGREMKRIQRGHRDREWLYGTSQYRFRQFDQLHPAKHHASLLAMRSGEPVSMDSVPDLVFEQFTGNQGFRPKPGRRRSRFAEHACERNRAVDVDHRSSRSRSKSANNFSKVRPGTGLPFGGQSGPRTAGLIQPSRTP